MSPSTQNPSYKFVSDTAVLVEFGTTVDDQLNQAVVALDSAISKSSIEGLIEVIPGMVNLLVIFDPLITNHAQIKEIIKLQFPLQFDNTAANRHHVLDVCYERELAPDLENVASACDMSAESVINVHSNSNYRVSMYGFAPGFAYLSGVPKSIQVPRKDAAVRDIPTGSVMIAGPQCLTTTMVMPTGWSIIGRSNAEIMTDSPDQPFLFEVGDTVSFKRIRSDELKLQSK